MSELEPTSCCGCKKRSEEMAGHQGLFVLSGGRPIRKFPRLDLRLPFHVTYRLSKKAPIADVSWPSPPHATLRQIVPAASLKRPGASSGALRFASRAVKSGLSLHCLFNCLQTSLTTRAGGLYAVGLVLANKFYCGSLGFRAGCKGLPIEHGQGRPPNVVVSVGETHANPLRLGSS